MFIFLICSILITVFGLYAYNLSKTNWSNFVLMVTFVWSILIISWSIAFASTAYVEMHIVFRILFIAALYVIAFAVLKTRKG